MSLIDIIAARIRSDGPLTVADYMSLCLTHPEHGYYATRDPLGAAGDFTTAPEMTQAFGELIGAWAVAAWQSLGAPDPFILCELGPGRGTLMRDALRAAQLAPGFMQAKQLYLLETSPALKAMQAGLLQSHNPQWISHPTDLPALPVIFIANEFFDALPMRQFVCEEAGWRERAVTLNNSGGLTFTTITAIDAPQFPAPAGCVLETSPAALDFASAMARPIVHNRGAALIIDYGDEEVMAETLQAVAKHRAAGILTEPGTADLTAHVSFAPLRTVVRKIGTRTHGPVDLGDFLLTLGLKERTAALCAKADKAQKRSLTLAMQRLTATATPGDMGRLFKVFVFTDRATSPPDGNFS